MQVEFFNVEHGACTLITLDNGMRIAIDCGHNATTGWTLGQHLNRLGIHRLDELWLTNLDQDHLSGLCNLYQCVRVDNILMNPTISARYLREMKREGGRPTDDIELLCRLIDTCYVNRPVVALPPDVGVVYAWNVAGAGFNDSNNLSLVSAVGLGRVNFLFPGDVEAAGMKRLLTLPLLSAAIRHTHVLVAPHHGRDNGCCDLMFDAMAEDSPQVCVISDGKIKYDSQLTQSWYGNRIRGVVTTTGEYRKVVTTRADGKITIEIPSGCLGSLTTQREHIRRGLASIFA